MLTIFSKSKKNGNTSCGKKSICHFLFFFPFIFIGWRLIILQYYSGFVIHWHESATFNWKISLDQKQNLPALQDTQVRSLGWEDPLVKWIGSHSSIFAGQSHGQRILVVYSPWGHKESDPTEWLTHTQKNNWMSETFWSPVGNRHR